MTERERANMPKTITYSPDSIIKNINEDLKVEKRKGANI